MGPLNPCGSRTSQRCVSSLRKSLLDHTGPGKAGPGVFSLLSTLGKTIKEAFKVKLLARSSDMYHEKI